MQCNKDGTMCNRKQTGGHFVQIKHIILTSGGIQLLVNILKIRDNGLDSDFFFVPSGWKIKLFCVVVFFLFCVVCLYRNCFRK